MAEREQQETPEQIRKPSNVKPGFGLRIEPGGPGPVEVVVDPVVGKGQAVRLSVRGPPGTFISRFEDLKVPLCPTDGAALRQLRRDGEPRWVCRTCRQDFPVRPEDVRA